ncbi:NAD(P)-binding protein [Parathielavia appendiculata]|uniref:NAD(P)-binding protein n=1 Tax=Parathielavia appendiculata TaxID=2587402 RepID=A0AAN6U4W6_9PEZI|nr:NAD(P)-binding protein [Parathielavia appendiculata]
MSDNTIYLITGANRGIGLAITTLLLARPHTTVVATSRTPAPSLFSPPFEGGAIHPSSRLCPILLNEADPAITSASLPARLEAEHGITRLDVVVANAGGSKIVKGLMDTDPATELMGDFEVNAVGQAKLFRGIWGMMMIDHPAAGDGGDGASAFMGGEGGKEKKKKFVLMSSTLGSIGVLEQECMPGIGYGMAKAAANWFAKRVSVEFRGRGLVVGVLHPGWVQTELGQALADAIGFKEPPLSVEESARGCVEQIDNWTMEKTGQFLTWTGQPLPW